MQLNLSESFHFFLFLLLFIDDLLNRAELPKDDAEEYLHNELTVEVSNLRAEGDSFDLTRIIMFNRKKEVNDLCPVEGHNE